jgi:hypothetical protein
MQYAVAFSFPAVANALGPARFIGELQPALKLCIGADDIRTHRTLAFGLAAFAKVVPRVSLTGIAFDLARDVPDVAIGVISQLSELLPLIDDAKAFVFCLRIPAARFVVWRNEINCL